MEKYNEFKMVETSSYVDCNYSCCRWPVTILCDVSGSMQPFLGKLNEQLKILFDSIRSSEIGRMFFEICIMTFGNGKISLIRDFQLLGDKDISPEFQVLDGDTPLGEGILNSLFISEKRKEKIKATFNGLGTYKQPLIIICSDFKHNSTLKANGKAVFDEAIEQSKIFQLNKKAGIICIGCGNQIDKEQMNRISDYSISRLDKNEFEKILILLFQILQMSIMATKDEMKQIVARIQTDIGQSVDSDFNKIADNIIAIAMEEEENNSMDFGFVDE